LPATGRNSVACAAAVIRALYSAMSKRIQFFVDTFYQLTKLSSDRHWQRALDASRKWEKLTLSGKPTDEAVDRLRMSLEREPWSGRNSLWRQMMIAFAEWARSEGFDLPDYNSSEETDDRFPPLAMRYEDVVDNAILYYFPSTGNLATESRRGLFVALRWKRLLEAESVSATDVEGVLGALSQDDIDCSTEPCNQWHFLRNQITAWALEEGILKPEQVEH